MIAILCHGELDPNLKESILACPQKIAVDGGLQSFAALNLEPNWIIGDFDSVQTGLLKRYPQEIQKPLSRAKDKTDLEAALELVFAENPNESIKVFGGLGGRQDHLLTHLFFLLRYPSRLFLESAHESVLGLSSDSDEYLIERNKWSAFALFPLNGPFKLVDRAVSEPKLLFMTLEKDFVLKLTEGEAIVVLLKENTTTPLLVFLTELAIKNDLFIQPGQKLEAPSQRGLTLSLIPFFGPAEGVKTEGLKWNLDHQTLSKDFLSISNVCLGDNFSVEIEKRRAHLLFVSESHRSRDAGSVICAAFKSLSRKVAQRPVWGKLRSICTVFSFWSSSVRRA